MASQHQQPYLPLPAGDLGLLTDFYELTMAQSYFAEGMDDVATSASTCGNIHPTAGT